MLSNQEATLLCLYLSPKNRVSSTTKLNKIVAFLNIKCIPVGVFFTLNKNGSYSKELLEECESLIDKKEYEFNGGVGQSYTANQKGLEFGKSVFEHKIVPNFEPNEIEDLKSSIEYFNILDSHHLSSLEHTKLKVNVEDRFRLQQDSNELHINYMDIYQKFKKLKSENYEIIDIKGITQFYLFISAHLRKKFNKLDEAVYEWNAPMINYYLFFILFDQLKLLDKPIKELINSRHINKLNRDYQAVKELIDFYEFPVSLENPNLSDTIGPIN